MRFRGCRINAPACRLGTAGAAVMIAGMAIQFARARYLSRAAGGNAVRSAAYNAREAIEAERTGEVFYFRHRDAPEHHEVLLPEGAAGQFRDSGVLWNAAELAEKRRDAQVAREIVVALPADAAITSEDRIELVRSFAEQHFVGKGLAVQLDVHAPHAPHEGEAESERANWHAHLLITTRRLDGDQFSSKKARDLDPEVRRAGGRAIVADGEAWGELWRDHQNRYFREHRIELEVDPTAAHPAPHIGPIRMRVAGSEIVERAEQIRRANEAAARDPDQVLTALTRHNATFTLRDLDRFLAKHLADEAECQVVKQQVLEHRELIPLYDRDTGQRAGRFTIAAVREQERNALADAAALAGMRGAAVPLAATLDLVEGRGLRHDQLQAFVHAVDAGGLKLIEGRAGTGKSYALGVIREAYEEAGQRVIGLAPTNAVAQDLKASGFGEASTVHAALFALKNGRSEWSRHTVVIVDEAAMLDARITGELLGAARSSGAKVILAGDDRQLASIERGGLFTELKARHGAAEITEVTRQRVDWQRRAAHDLAEGRFGAAVAAYDEAGAITWTRDQDQARTALVEAWRRDTAAEPAAKRFVFAYTNRDVDTLNAELRQVRRERGELSGLEVMLETRHGPAVFAVGDRVQFTDTDKKAGIYNGNAGTITGIDERTGKLRAMLDAPAAGKGREVAWSAAEFSGFRHGYAGTIYKGQGKTLDHTYLYHTRHWRAAASYVALTRQRDSAQVFVARATARDTRALAWQMARGEIKAASIAWATREELTAAQLREKQAGWEHAGTRSTAQDDSLRAKVYQALQRRETSEQRVEEFWQNSAAAVPSPARDPLTDKVETASEMRQQQAEAFWRSTIAAAPPTPDSLTAKVRAASEARQHQAELPAPEWLIPPYVSRDGGDSLGRGLDPAGIAAAVAADERVQQARSEPWRYLERAYREPHMAQARLNELARAEGWTEAAARIDEAHEQLGRLRGHDGMFAGPSAQLERAYAIIAARSLGDSLRRIAEVERPAERQYREDVTAQLQRDAVGVPQLSTEAAAVLETVHAARTGQPGESGYLADTRDRPAVARAWEAGQSNPAIVAEIDRFEKAAEQRLGGEEGIAAFLCNADEGRPSLPGVEPGQERALTELARGLAAVRRGRSDHQLQRAQDTAEHSQDRQQRSRHRHGPSLGR
jgi:Ti-type conjugative transfer relaxase TraA